MIIADGPARPGEKVVTEVTLRGWFIWIAAALFYLYEFFVRVAPSTMEPELQRAFSLSAAGLGAMIGVYYTIYAPCQLLAGSLLDRFGARNVLVPAALVCTGGCFLEILGHSPFWLGAARFCQGLGSAFAFVGTMYLAAEWFPRSMLARLSGLTTSLGMAGAIMGNSGIARVVETLGWHRALLVAGFVGLGVTAIIFFVVPRESRHRQARAEKAELPRGPGLFASLKAVAGNPQSWLAGIAGTALYMPLSILGALWGVEYLMSITGGDKVAGAGAVSMLYVGWLIGGPIAGWYSDRSGQRRNLLLGAGVATLLVTLAVVLTPHISVTAAYALMLLLGLASTSQVVCFVTAIEHNPPAVAGTAIAATNMMIMLLGGMGEWAFGYILDLVTPGVGHPAAGYPEASYRKAILLLPLISAIGVAAAFFLTEARRKKPMPAGPEPVA
ncbi:MAG TPA: MFS transporter [Chthoniobacterales bacterium]|jgi:MFS family permease